MLRDLETDPPPDFVDWFSVERVDGPLLLDRPCDYVWNDASGCALQCSSVIAQPTCLDIAMPDEHCAATTYCASGHDEGCASTAAPSSRSAAPSRSVVANRTCCTCAANRCSAP